MVDKPLTEDFKAGYRQAQADAVASRSDELNRLGMLDEATGTERIWMGNWLDRESHENPSGTFVWRWDIERLQRGERPNSE